MVRTRIAPSPTGNPHIGTIFQALLNYALAKKNQGKFIVRIEDTDQSRLVKGSEEAIFKALDWFGLTPDESVNHGSERKSYPFRQSENLPKYQQHAQKLVDINKAYYCFCSPDRLSRIRQNMQKKGKPPMYDGKCRALNKSAAAAKAKKEPHVIRMKINQSGPQIVIHDDIRGDITFDPKVLDDQVLLKSDGYPTYHLAVVVDDHFMKISHVIRGEEWISSTPKHVLLYQYFGWSPPSFIHTPLLRNTDKSKLGKRHGHASVSWYREKGYLVEAILNFLATRVWNHPRQKEIFSLEEFVDNFSFETMHIHSPVVDLDKLDWLNGQWIRRLPEKDIFERLKPFQPQDLSTSKLKSFWPLIKDRLSHLSQLTDLTSYLVNSPQVDPKLILKESKTNPQATQKFLAKTTSTVQAINNWTVENLDKALHQLQQDVAWKPRAAFMTIRLATTGRLATPPLFDTMHIIGQEKVIQRLKHAQKILS